MAKKQTKDTHTVSACEQYVVEELKQAKEENEQLKQVIKNLQSINKLENEKYDSLMELVKKALKGAKVKDDRFTQVYINNMFVGLFNKDNILKEEEPLVALAKLIELVQRTPERE